jgi:hypothetical protein
MCCNRYDEQDAIDYIISHCPDGLDQSMVCMIMNFWSRNEKRFIEEARQEQNTTLPNINPTALVCAAFPGVNPDLIRVIFDQQEGYLQSLGLIF